MNLQMYGISNTAFLNSVTLEQWANFLLKNNLSVHIVNNKAVTW